MFSVAIFAIPPLVVLSSIRLAPSSIKSQDEMRSTFVIALKEVMSNQIFRFAIVTHGISTAAHALPNSLKNHAVKNVLYAENAAQVIASLHLITEIVNLLSNLILTLAVRRFPLHLLFVISNAVSFLYASHVYFDIQAVGYTHYLVNSVFITVAHLTGGMVKRQMLTDSIFYDALHSGQMRGGLYGSIEGSLHTMVSMSTLTDSSTP